ncbi:MAG: TonB-dependent receptor plug domain-containing protein [bacterium]
MLKKTVLVMLTALLIFWVPVSAQEEVMELDEVVVTASRYEESIMETPVSIEVISQEEIEESGAVSLAEILAAAGGIHIKDNGGLTGQKDIIIRGIRGKQILFLLDGQPYNNPNDGGINLESIPVEFIKRIEVLKSPSSAIYGANAMGGVINIISKEAKDLEKTNLKFETGSFDTQKVNLSHSFKGNKSSLTLIYDRLFSDGHRENSSLDREDFFLKYNYQITNYSDLSLAFRNNEKETDYPGQDPNYLSDEYLTAQPFGPSPSGSTEDSDQNINLTINQKLENKERKLSIYNNDRTLKDLSWNTITDINKKGISLMQTNYINKHTLSYGLDIIEEGVETDNYKEDNINKAIFIQDKYNFNNDTVLNLGARYDEHEEYGAELSPRLGIIYKLTDNLNLNANVGESFKAPSYMDLYFPGANNPDLKAEKAVSYDVGFKYRDQVCQREITFFKRNIDQLIKYNSSKNMPENIDSAELKGIELNTDRKINNDFNIGVNYTYLDASNEESQEQIGDMPYHSFGLDLKYVFNNTKFILNNRYTGERTDYVTNEELPSHFISDLNVVKKINENSKVSISINNLFDKDYEVVDGYPMPERNYMLSISTKF